MYFSELYWTSFSSSFPLCFTKELFSSKEGKGIFPNIHLQSLMCQPLKPSGQMPSIRGMTKTRNSHCPSACDCVENTKLLWWSSVTDIFCLSFKQLSACHTFLHCKGLSVSREEFYIHLLSINFFSSFGTLCSWTHCFEVAWQISFFIMIPVACWALKPPSENNLETVVSHT